MKKLVIAAGTGFLGKVLIDHFKNKCDEIIIFSKFNQMTEIRLETIINAPIKVVFDISRSIDAHTVSTSQTNETAISGRTSGLIELNETVKWKGRHFGVYLTHESKITEFNFPTYFVDEMIDGQFKYFRHEHFYSGESEGTLMLDVIRYKTPFGIIGKLFDRLILKKHLRTLIEKRNQVLKSLAESQN